MTPVEELIEAANRRHFREISVAAAKPSRLGQDGKCPTCRSVLNMAEIIERHCITCAEVRAVRHG